MAWATAANAPITQSDGRQSVDTAMSCVGHNSPTFQQVGDQEHDTIMKVHCQSIQKYIDRQSRMNF